MSWWYTSSKTHLVVVQTGSVDSTLAAYHLQKAPQWDRADYVQYNPQDPNHESNLTRITVPQNGVVLCLGTHPPNAALRYFLESTRHVTVVSHKKPTQQPVIGVQYIYDPYKTSLMHVVDTYVVPFMDAQEKARVEAEAKAQKEAEAKAKKEEEAAAKAAAAAAKKDEEAKKEVKELKGEANPVPPLPALALATAVGAAGVKDEKKPDIVIEEKKEIPKPFYQALGYQTENHQYPWWYEIVNDAERGIYKEEGATVALQLVTKLRRLIQDQPFGTSLEPVYSLLKKSFAEFTDSVTVEQNDDHQDREKCLDKTELQMWKLPKEVCLVATMWPVLTCDFTSPLEIQRMALLGFEKNPTAKLMIARILPSAADVRAPRSVYYYVVKAPNPSMGPTDAPVVLEDLMKALGNATGETVICRSPPLAGEIPKLL